MDGWRRSVDVEWFWLNEIQMSWAKRVVMTMLRVVCEDMRSCSGTNHTAASGNAAGGFSECSTSWDYIGYNSEWAWSCGSLFDVSWSWYFRKPIHGPNVSWCSYSLVGQVDGFYHVGVTRGGERNKSSLFSDSAHLGWLGLVESLHVYLNPFWRRVTMSVNIYIRIYTYVYYIKLIIVSLFSLICLFMFFRLFELHR